MSAVCRPYISCRFTVYQPYIHRMSAVCQPSVSRMSAVYPQYVIRRTAVRQPYISCMSAIYPPYVSHTKSPNFPPFPACQAEPGQLQARIQKHWNDCPMTRSPNLDMQINFKNNFDCKIKLGLHSPAQFQFNTYERLSFIPCRGPDTEQIKVQTLH